MSAFNSAGMNFGYPTSKGNNFDFYSFGSMQSLDFGNTYHFEPDAAITEQDTYGLNPSTEEYIDQFGYQECTFLNVSEGQFVSPHTLHMVSPYETGTNNHGLNRTERPTIIPAERVPPSVADLAPWFSSTHDTPPSLAILTCPVAPPQILPQSDDYVLIPAPSYTAETLSHSPFAKPLVSQLSDNRWSDAYLVTSVDKGKAQAVDHIPPLHQASWNHQKPRAAETCVKSSLQMVPDVPPNADFPAPIVPSSPPQRFERGTKTKTEATQRSKGKCKHELTETLPEDVGSTWEETKDRLIWELLEVYYFRPAGGPINRETAFALTRKALGEDLHRSPLAAQVEKARVDGKQSRVYERYLTHILTELRRSKSGEIQNETLMYTQVLAELRSELIPINKRRVLRNGHSNKNDPSKLKNARKQVRHRVAEQERRTTIRHLQDQISAFFLVQGQKKISVGDLLLFVIIYLRIGEVAFSGLIQLRPPGSR